MHATIPANWNTLQRVFLGLGAVGLLVSCAMTYKFGSAMSWLHAVSLVTVTVMAAFIFPAKRFIEQMGVSRVARNVATILGCFFVALEFYSHLGYTVGMRNKASLEATVQTAAYKNTQESLSDEKANLSMWRKQLEDLKSQKEWAPSVTADGLRAQLSAADKRIELEGKRGGCKSKCLRLMEEKGALESKIATAEKVDDLTKRIEATQRILDGKTEKAVSTKTGFSAAAAQTDWMGKIYLLATGTEAAEALNPDQVTLTVTDIVIGFFIALGATTLPTTAFYFAFFGVAPSAPAQGVWQRQAERNAKTQAKDGVKVVNNYIDRTDDSWKRELHDAANSFRIPTLGAAA